MRGWRCRWKYYTQEWECWWGRDEGADADLNILVMLSAQAWGSFFFFFFFFHRLPLADGPRVENVHILLFDGERGCACVGGWFLHGCVEAEDTVCEGLCTCRSLPPCLLVHVCLLTCACCASLNFNVCVWPCLVTVHLIYNSVFLHNKLMESYMHELE